MPFFRMSLVVVGCWTFVAASATEINPARLSELVAQLGASDPSLRDSAEAEILKLGPPVLEHLPDPQSMELSSEQKYRLERLLDKLRELRSQQADNASLVQLDAGPISIGELFATMQKQTGNSIAPRDGLDVEALAIKIDRKAGEHEFWPLLDDIAARAGIALDLSGRDRVIRFTIDPHPAPPPGGEGSEDWSKVTYHGAFRFELDRVLLIRRFTQPGGQSTCHVEATVAVEPRLAPLQIVLKGDQCQATDDKGRSLAFEGPQRAYAGFEEGAMQTRLSFSFSSPERDARSIQSLQAELEVLIPSAVETFAFDRDTGFTNVRGKKYDVAVALDEFAEEDDGIWIARFTVRRDADDMALDSYLRAMIKNDIHLEAKDGTKSTVNGGMNSREIGPGATQFEYIFVDQAGKLEDMRLVVRVPTGFVRAMVPMRFENIPLP